MVNISDVPFVHHITLFARVFPKLNQTNISFAYMNAFDLIEISRAMDYFMIILTKSEEEKFYEHLTNCLERFTIRQLLNFRDYHILPNDYDILIIWRSVMEKLISKTSTTKWLNRIYKTLEKHADVHLIDLWCQQVFRINTTKYAELYFCTMRRINLVTGADVDWLCTNDDYYRYIDDYDMEVRKRWSRYRSRQIELFSNEKVKANFYNSNFVINADTSFLPYLNHKTKNKYITDIWQPNAPLWCEHPIYILRSVCNSSF
jgi:hypothetical protein